MHKFYPLLIMQVICLRKVRTKNLKFDIYDISLRLTQPFYCHPQQYWALLGLSSYTAEHYLLTQFYSILIEQLINLRKV